MISQYLELPDMAFISDARGFTAFELGSFVRFSEEEIYDFSPYDIALIGVKESRAAGFKNLGSDLAPDEIRKYLYRLHTGSSFPNMIDLGNILDAETVGETYEYLEKVLNVLYKHNVTVLILGGSQDLTYPQFLGFENIVDSVSMLVVDERIDLAQSQSQVTSDAFLQHIMTHHRPELFHCTLLGIQAYYTHPQILDVLNSMSYYHVRLGQARYSLPQYQQVFEMADMVSVDVSAVKQSDAPARGMQTPNGFLSDEFCLIARYSGMSEKVKSFGIYEVNPQLDIRYHTAQLAAQAVWFFMEGYSYRSAIHPLHDDYQDDFHIFMVEMPEFGSTPFHFWHSKSTQKWWVEFPIDTKRDDRFQPCGKSDYESCARGEMSTWLFSLYSKIS